MVKTLIILRVHRRVNLLPRIRESLREALGVLPEAGLVLAPNNPTEEVLEAIQGMPAIAVVPTTTPVYDPTRVPVDGHGRIQSEIVEALERDFDWEWLVWHCDDWVLEPGGWEDMAEIMRSGVADVIAVDALYFWDGLDGRLYNRRAYRTVDEIAFRWRRGLRWSALDVGFCPQDLQLEARARNRVVVMERRRLDYGFATEEERRRALRARVRAGLVDDYISPLLLEPDLVEYSSERKPVTARLATHTG